MYSALPSLHGVPRDGSPASSVLWIATTPYRPSPRTSFPSFGGYRGGAHPFAPTGGRRRAPVSLDFGLPVPTGVVAAETTGPPRFLGEPLCVHALLFDPGGWVTPGQSSAPVLPSAAVATSAPQFRPFRGPFTRPAHSLSTPRTVSYPTRAQDSLPVGGQPFAGQDWLPAKVHCRRFQRLVTSCLIPLLQASPGATQPGLRILFARHPPSPKATARQASLDYDNQPPI